VTEPVDRIREMVDRETSAWNERDAEALVGFSHTGLLAYPPRGG
jgi:hypothetical protein